MATGHRLVSRAWPVLAPPTAGRSRGGRASRRDGDIRQDNDHSGRPGYPGPAERAKRKLRWICRGRGPRYSTGAASCRPRSRHLHAWRDGARRGGDPAGRRRRHLDRERASCHARRPRRDAPRKIGDGAGSRRDRHRGTESCSTWTPRVPEPRGQLRIGETNRVERQGSGAISSRVRPAVSGNWVSTISGTAAPRTQSSDTAVQLEPATL